MTIGELQKLMEKMDKNKIQETLEKLKLSDKDIEKELDRTLEQFKQMEIQQNDAGVGLSFAGAVFLDKRQGHFAIHKQLHIVRLAHLIQRMAQPHDLRRIVFNH